MKFLYKVSLLVFLLGSLSACTKTEKIIERQAPADVSESFAQATCKDSFCLKISKGSLDKVYLMMVSGRGGSVTPQWYDFKPQLVSFSKVGDQIALFEENRLSIYEEIKNRELIQTFPVVSDDGSEVTFKWGSGLRTLVYESPIDIKGPEGMPKDPEEEGGPQRQFMPVIEAVTVYARVQSDMMEVRQVSKVRATVDKKGIADETLGMNIQFTPYVPKVNFQARVADPSRQVGFFVTNTALKGYSTKQLAYANRWDIDQPIKVLISSAVPAEYVEAVKEGARYWDLVFGKKVMEIVTGVDPQVEPSNRTIIVRWIPWLDSGAAYALHQTDPLTGEIIRAQVFMPSVFTRVGSKDLVDLNGKKPVAVGQGAIACDLSTKFVMLDELMKEADDSKRLKLAQDSVRATMAHEIGHALGMRHNFAGSYSAKVSTQEIETSAATYLKDKNHKGLEASTSIMDYLAGIDDVLTAAYIKHSPLSYDKMAMDYAVSGIKPDAKVSLYCTDEDISIAKSQDFQIYGCERFDAGNNPLLRRFNEAKQEKEDFFQVLFTSILGRLYSPDPVNPDRDLKGVLAETNQWMVLRLSSLPYVSDVIFDLKRDQTTTSRFVSLETYLSDPFALKISGQLDEQLDAKLKKDIEELGGLDKIFSDLVVKDNALDLNWYSRQLQDLLNQDYFKQGKTLAGRSYVLKDTEQEEIKSLFEEYEDVNQVALLFAYSRHLLPQIKTLDDGGQAQLVLRRGLQDLYGEQMASTLLAWATTPKETVVGKVGLGLKQSVTLEISALPKSIRTHANKLASSDYMGVNAYPVFDKVKATLLARIANVLSVALDVRASDITAINLEERFQAAEETKVLDTQTSRWLKGEIEFFRSIVPAQTGNLADRL